MDSKTEQALRRMNELHPDVFPSQEIERFIKGLPADPEFGPLKPRPDGCHLELHVDCPPNGIQKLGVSLHDSDSIDLLQRGILQTMKKEWPTIWSEARSAWFKEYPTDEEVITNQWHWVLDGEIPSDTTLQEEFEGNPVWQLSISGNAAATIVNLTMEGSTVLDAELL
jgi:hypothetical protein